jgi:cytochrome P450
LLLQDQLATQSEIQERLRAEVKDVPLDYDNVTRARPYMQAVINENLRFNPPVPGLPWRQIEGDSSISIDGVTLTKECILHIPQYTIHRSPSIWGPDANIFNPDRFLKDNCPKAFFPFGTGVRRCLGEPLARLELHYIIIYTLQRYRLSAPVGLKSIHWSPRGTLAAYSPIEVIFEKI